MTTACKIRALLIASFVVALMGITAKSIFFKAKEHAEETTQLAQTAVALEQKVVTLEEYAAAMTASRATLLSVIDFHIDNPRSVLFVANPDGVITDVDGVVSKWGYTRTQLIGMRVEDLRPKSDRVGYRINYTARAKEGKTGDVFFFNDSILLGGDGNEYRVNGGVFWHGDRKEFVAFIAPTASENP